MTLEEVGTTPIDITPIVDYFIYAALSVVSVGTAWGIRMLNKWAGIKTDDAMNKRINDGLMNGLRSAYEKNRTALLGADGKATLEIKSKILADGAQYVIDRFPDATKHFGVERPEQLGELAGALLPKIETESPVIP